MSDTIETTPNTIRNANKRAIEKRSAWRRKYKLLSSMIRSSKHCVAMESRYGAPKSFIIEDLTHLKALQHEANEMMIRRAELAMDLRLTSYNWA